MVSKNEKYSPTDLVWGDVNVFLAIARHGTLSAAALQMKLGIATLSRRIERLEQVLQTPLFLRQQSGYRLTEEGRHLLGKAEAMEAAAQALWSKRDHEQPLAGRVRLATAENLATGLIIPHLTAFKAQYPAIELELITDVTTANIHRHDADLALRMVRPERGHVRFRQLGTLGYGLYASNAYLAARKRPPSDVSDDSVITWDSSLAHLPLAQWLSERFPARQTTLSTTTLSTQIAAASAGLGLALIPHFLGLAAGLQCMDADIDFSQPIYLVIQADLGQSRRTRALADFLVALIDDHRDMLAFGDNKPRAPL